MLTESQSGRSYDADWIDVYDETFQKTPQELYSILKNRGIKVVRLDREHAPHALLEMSRGLKPADVRLSESISKLGRILGWSLPAPITRVPVDNAVFLTCPAATRYCTRVCYAQRHHFRNPEVQLSHFRNFLATLRDDFPKIMTALLRYEENFNTVKIFRIHVSGDFYSEKYIRQWRIIAENLPDWRFYAYTRAWLVPNLRKAVESELITLSNFTVYASTDPDTPAPPSSWLEAAIASRETFWRWIEGLNRSERTKLIEWILLENEADDLFETHKVKEFANGKPWRWCMEEAAKMLLYARYERRLVKHFGISRTELADMLRDRFKVENPKTLYDVVPKCDICMYCPLGRGNVVFIEH